MSINLQQYIAAFEIAKTNTIICIPPFVSISPAEHYDWESVAVGPCSQGSQMTCIYILDDGEYRGVDSRTIYRLQEPDVMQSQTLAPEAKLVYKYVIHKYCWCGKVV